ncbi:MAG: sulfotransferase [Dokdonella sp.]
MPAPSAAIPRLQGLSQVAIQSVIATAQALEAGRVDEAARQIASLLASYPTQAEVLRLHAGIESQRGNYPIAIRAMQEAVSQRPDDALYQNTLGTILAEAGDYDAAIAALRHCCALQPELAIAWFNLGILLTRCVRHDEAIAALQTTVKLAPDHASARALLADMLRVGNRAAEAANAYRSILAERPCAGMAWWGLADLKTIKFADGDIERMQAAMADARASDDDLIATGFAYAKALDDASRYAESLAALERANTVARRRRHWDADAFSSGMSTIRGAFSPAPQASSRALGKEVLFIVSLPRSGSTLIEQILASHPSVEGAGELPDLPLVIGEESRRRQQAFPFWVRAMTPEDWQRLGHRYLERTEHWIHRRPIFTDKLPNNWYYIGAIRAMLPGARIVVVRRDPLETCFSCYRQFLYNNEYTRTFADLAAFWREFDSSISAARIQHPTHVHESVHEHLLAEPEVHIRALLDFCGLPFDPACLQFHRTERDVRSPSAMQVREPLRRDTARTPRYGSLLDALRSELGMPPFAA